MVNLMIIFSLATSMLSAAPDDLVDRMEDEMDRALEREMRRNYNRLRQIAEERARRQQLRRNRYAVILPPAVPSSLALDDYHLGRLGRDFRRCPID